MKSYTTEAWVLRPSDIKKNPPPGELELDHFAIGEPNDDEVLVEPIYGCWEGNMGHAMDRRPVDICQMRGEDKVVLGNSGVVRVLKPGSPSSPFKEGDFCYVFGSAIQDKYGYMTKALAYDAENTMGIQAKRSVLPACTLMPIPKNTAFSLQQWASFSLRYVTAWANWKIAYNVWRIQMPESIQPVPYVLGWGGGVSLAQLALAKFHGSKVAMVASRPSRLDQIEQAGIIPIDRSNFPHLCYDEKRYYQDAEFREKYTASEKAFLAHIKEINGGEKADMVIDNIGSPVFRATLKALARQGVFTTSGWKAGMQSYTLRAIESISRHQHVHTHYALYSEGIAATHFAEQTGWMAPKEKVIHDWENIGKLGLEYNQGAIESYFPIYQINPE